ncbi:DUF503 domain-containing protein [Lutibacter sp. B2]|nr:DUF503 domain-containing protein [Lutibacter sp. B2]
MIICSCMVEIVLYEANSLKDKRQIIKSLIGRIQSRFNVSIAEVDMNDLWRRSVIGFACVSKTSKHASQMVDHIIEFVEGDTRVEIIKCDREIL